MDSPGWYRVDPRKVAHETIDGEVIMIHLLIGSYYSLRGAGADIWDSLASGRDRAQTLAFLEQRYEGAPPLTPHPGDGLPKELEKEAPLEPAADEAAGANGAPPTAVAERKPFEVPAL